MRRAKYNNKKVTIDGHKFDSLKESRRYLVLKNRQEQGLISDLELQPTFVLQDSYRRNGKAVRAIKYIADFRYTHGISVIVEDVKNPATAKDKVYVIKKKILLFKYPALDFVEVI